MAFGALLRQEVKMERELLCIPRMSRRSINVQSFLFIPLVHFKNPHLVRTFGCNRTSFRRMTHWIAVHFEPLFPLKTEVNFPNDGWRSTAETETERESRVGQSFLSQASLASPCLLSTEFWWHNTVVHCTVLYSSRVKKTLASNRPTAPWPSSTHSGRSRLSVIWESVFAELHRTTRHSIQKPSSMSSSLNSSLLCPFWKVHPNQWTVPRNREEKRNRETSTWIPTNSLGDDFAVLSPKNGPLR